MSGTLPTTPKFQSMTMSSERTVTMSTSLSLRTQARDLGGHRWTFRLTYPPMTRSDFAPVDAFIESQAGIDTFTITSMPVADALGTPTGTVQTSGTASLGAKTVSVSGLSGTFKAGSLIKFATHDKVYKLTADRAGAGAITFEPGLRLALSAGVAVTYNDVPITVRLSGPVQEYGLATDLYVSYELDLVEAV